MSTRSTKKDSNTAMTSQTDELRPEYRREDLGRGVRGKYHRQHLQGTNLVLLQPEVARLFPTSEAVNEALLGLAKLAQPLPKS